MAEISYKIKKQIAVLAAQSGKGWKKELNLISWNGFEPKYDIRDWDSTHSKMGKGVTLTKNELKELYSVLKIMFEDGIDAPTSKGNSKNVSDKVNNFVHKAPMIVQEIKNLISYMADKGYSVEMKKCILLGQAPNDAEPALINEVESMRSMYSSFFEEFTSLLNELDGHETDVFIDLLEKI